jgi:hypothetical protein
MVIRSDARNGKNYDVHTICDSDFERQTYLDGNILEEIRR